MTAFTKCWILIGSDDVFQLIMYGTLGMWTDLSCFINSLNKAACIFPQWDLEKKRKEKKQHGKKGINGPWKLLGCDLNNPHDSGLYVLGSH